MCVSGCDFWCIFPVPFVLRLCLRRPVLDREASGVESKYLVVVRPVITHNAGWGTSLAWGPEGYETILLLILFKMAASCLSGHLPVCLSVCVSHLCKIWCSRADVQLVYGNSILPYLIASSSRPPSHDSLYEPSPLTPTVFHAPCYSFWFCVCVCVFWETCTDSFERACRGFVFLIHECSIFIGDLRLCSVLYVDQMIERLTARK